MFVFKNVKRFQKLIWFSVGALSVIGCRHFRIAYLWSDRRAPKGSWKRPKSISFLLEKGQAVPKINLFFSGQISPYPITLSQYIF